MTILGSYDDRLLTARDRLRALLGDTQAAAWLLSDTYLDAILSEAAGDVDAAAIRASQQLIAQYATQPTRVTADGVTVEYGQRLVGWQTTLAAAQARQAATTTGNVWGAVPVRYTTSATQDEYSR